MASAPNQSLPLFYKNLVPLNSEQHKGFRVRPTGRPRRSSSTSMPCR